MKKYRFLFFCLLLTTCFFTVVSNAAIRYVKPVATGSGSGANWTNASGNLQAMINASIADDQVWVMAGTYKPADYPTGGTGGLSNRDNAFVLKNGVKIYGGFVGNEISLAARTSAVIIANPSILSGDIGIINDVSDNVFHVIYSVSDNASTVLDGFIITKGNSNGSNYMTIETKEVNRNTGGGMVLVSSNPTISNCIVTSNSASFYGGGIFNSTSSPILSKCTISSNNASQYGGGLYNSTASSPSISECFFNLNTANFYGGGIFNSESSAPAISKCVFSSNSTSTNSGSYGGGVYNTESKPTITNCVFTSNSSHSGGGIVNANSSDIVLTNCIFNANISNFGGGVFNLGASPIITNCTFFSNTSASNGGGGGIYNRRTDLIATNVKVQNCIFWKNTKNTFIGSIGADIENLSPAIVTVTNTALQLQNSTDNYPISGFLGLGTGNLYEVDPLFVASGNPIGTDNIWITEDDGLILQNCSPAINVGNNTHNLLPSDITNIANTRIKNTTIDLGAFENQFGTMTVSISQNPNTAFICKGTSVTFTASPTNVGLRPMYDFQINNVSIQKSSAATFTTSTLLDGDVVNVILTSAPIV